MNNDPIQEFFLRIADEGRALGAIVRCESHGVIAMVHPRHAKEEEQQPGLPLSVEDRTEGRKGGQGVGQSAQQ